MQRSLIQVDILTRTQMGDGQGGPKVAEHQRKMHAVSEQLHAQLRLHGVDCSCHQCMEVWEQFAVLQDNAPCLRCQGVGCVACNHTGWERRV